MDRPPSAARRRTFDLPTKPESGLAEWTSKIKELQRQVDEDEETETRRLEEEIRASRMARLRRSGQMNSVDLSKSELPRVASPPASPLGKQESQEEALKKLTGQTVASSVDHAKPAAPKTSMSLAEFMGGRATGPRLTRHTPQQDAHDPTQFEQRTLKNITTPHPIFGRGGVAMPGMVGRSRSAAPSTPEPEEPALSPTLPSHVTGRERKQSTPSIVQSILHKVEVESVSSQRTGTSVSSSYTTRQRTISTPTGGAPPVSAPPTRTWDTAVHGALSRPVSVSPGLRSTTPAQDRQTPLKSPYTPPPVSSSPRPSSATRTQAPSSPTMSSSPKASISTPSLARPIQPSPRTSLGPQLPASLNPSPAFLRAPPPKDPTPSISRLQGRGFVKSMVQATAQLSVGSPPPERKDTPSNSGGRKSAPVLERWQSAASTPSPPPIISPKPPAATRKSWTADPSPSADTTPPRPVKADHTGRSLKSASSVPSLADAVAAAAGDGSPRGRGLGSSTTMISYIKPLKTGDRPPTPPQDRARSRSRSKSRSRAQTEPEREAGAGVDVDEMGMRVHARSKSRHRSRSRHRSKSREAPREDVGGGEWRGSTGLPLAGKPLSHLTKDRAKKPRKARFASNPVRETRVVSSGTSVSMEKAPKGEQQQQQPPRISLVPMTPTVVVSVADVTQPVKPVSPLKDKFDDDFVPSAVATVPSKPSQLSELVIPKSPVATSPLLEQPLTPTRKTTPPKTPASPARHTRIPSTGNRATVMDVAQALAAQSVLSEPKPAPQEPPSVKQEVQVQAREEEAEEAYAPPDVKALAASWAHGAARPGANGAARPNAEMRKSSYERYSAIAMPTLEEERSPATSPAGTLARSAALAVPDVIPEVEVEAALAVDAKPAEVAAVEVVEEPPAPAESKVIHIGPVDEPLPTIDITELLDSGSTQHAPDADVQTISVDVMSVVGNMATAVSREPHVFYEHDVLAIIHRAKVRSTGLVSTKVWGWRGKRSPLGEREEQKLQGLARQYGTKLIQVQQYCEPAELLVVLGGQLAIRQGSRAHWSPENTAMHLVRSLHGVTYIDEVELSIRNLCSAFSYCLTLLDTLYVWHGCGSLDTERAVARDYAKALASPSSNVVELIEGQSDADDEMFWMILGEGDYARADYWKWRASSSSIYPRVWSVDVTRGADAIQLVLSFANHPDFHNLVHLVDCVWEFFVVVGSEARGKRADIRLALTAATKLSELTASSRPFAPTVHALILPSQLPTDLRLHFRDLDEAAVNYGQIPDHMNLLAAEDAVEHLKTTVWERTLTKDPSMLPLGVQMSDLR